jgi:hypothetical protein
MHCLVRVVFVLLLASAFVGCTRKPLTPATPWADLADDSLAFFTVTTDPGGQKVCYVFDWGDGTTTTTGHFASGDTGYCLREFAGTRVHYIRVRARNEKGVASGWSPELRFRLSEPPQMADTLSGLPRWATDRWYHTSVRVTDPDGDSVAAKFVWGDLPATGWSAFYPSGSVITDSCKWSVIGPHTVGVMLRDKGGTVSRPSAVKTVNVSSMAVVWYRDDDVAYDATPTLGMIDGGPVLYCGLYDVLDCYRLDGTLLWSTQVSGSACAPSLSADGSRLYLTGDDEGISCLDSRTGQLKWNLPLDALEQTSCTPALGPDGAIYITTYGSFDYWLRRVTDFGDSAAFDWGICLSDDWAAGENANGTVVARSGVVYTVALTAGSSHTDVFAVDSTGAVLWRDSTHVIYGGRPIVDGQDRVVVTDWAGGFYCYNRDGTLAYSVPTEGTYAGTTAIGHDDEVILTHYDGRVKGYDSTGHLLWTSTLGFEGMNTPCVADDNTVIVYDSDAACVYGIDGTGQTLWEYSVCDSLNLKKRSAVHLSEGDGDPSPVIGPNGDLYLVSYDGAVFCLSGANLRMANTAWPTYNHDNARSGWAGRP